MIIRKAYLKEVCFHFNSPAKTSRNTLKEKVSHYIILEGTSGKRGIGECSPIYGLSVEKEEDLRKKLKEVIEHINNQKDPFKIHLNGFPSIQFALDSAYSDLKQGAEHILFDNPFSEGKKSISINGLVWMSELTEMTEQVKEKVDKGFKCIKIKIGAHNFEHELSFLKELRENHGNDLEIRLDANGAFSPESALNNLKKLSEFNIHSIEQPIRAGQLKQMKEICIHSPIPIALDEELIGVDPKDALELLQFIRAKYIILKPSLIGSFSICDQWIEHAESLGMEWWATSALESNIGLNAIAQWVSQHKNLMYQGLGTGQIYANNIPSSLKLQGQELSYDKNDPWELNLLEL